MNRIRVQDYDLRLFNLIKYRVWEYALDEEEIEGQDEKTVRPLLAPPPINPRNSCIIVRASFYLMDGTVMKGYVKPLPYEGRRMLSSALPYDLHPTIVTDKTQIGFCYGTGKLEIDKVNLFYKKLSRVSGKVFPIQFSSDVDLVDCYAAGKIDGLMYFEESITDFFHLKSEDVQFVR